MGFNYSRAQLNLSAFDQILTDKGSIQELYSILRDLQGPQIGTRAIGGTARIATDGEALRNPDVVFTGIISYTPRVLSMTSSSIDIARDQDPNVYTSRLILANPSAFDLETILNANHAGQYLEIQGVLTETIVIKHGVGNIRTQTGSDITITDNQVITLRFDSIANEWVVVTDSTGGADNLGNHIATMDLDMGATNKIFNLKAIEWSNQFVITDGSIAQMGADPTGDFINNVATGDFFQSRVNDVEVDRLSILSNVTNYFIVQDDPTPSVGLSTRLGFLANNATPVLMIFGGIDMETEDTTVGNEDGSIHELVREQGSLATYVSYNAGAAREIRTFRDIVMSVLTNLTIDQGALFLNSAENMSIQEVGTTIMEFNSNAGIGSSVQLKAEDVLNLNLNKTSALFQPGIAVEMGQLKLAGRDPAPIFAVDGFFWHNDVTGPLKGHVFVRTAGKNVDLAKLLTNPMTEDLDFDTFDAFDIDRLSFFSGTSISDTLAIGLSKAASDVLRINTISGGDIILTEEEVIRFRFDGTTNEVQAVDSILTVFRTGPPITRYQMVMASDRVILDHPDKMQFQIGSITQFELTDANVNFADGKGIISNIDQLGFRNLGNIIQDDAGGMVYDVIPTQSHRFADGTNDFMELFVDHALHQEWYWDFISRVSPGVTGAANRGRLFMNSANSNHLSIIRNGGVIDLELSGEVFLWTADHDADTNNLLRIKNLVHVKTTATTALDFADAELEEISISANTTFTGTGYAIGRTKVIKITTDATLRTLTFPATWSFIGALGRPADQAASKTGVLTITCFTAAEAGVVAAYAVEP